MVAVYMHQLVGQIIAGEFLKMSMNQAIEVNKDGVTNGANALQVSGGIPDVFQIQMRNRGITRLTSRRMMN